MAVYQIVGGAALLVVAGGAYWLGGPDPAAVTNFAECIAAGNPVMESYPRQCRSEDGELFREDIGNELEKDDLIRIERPRPNESVKSPLTIAGMARGTWFFEGDFPVYVTDWDGKIIGTGYAGAQGEWMTEAFVPFAGIIEFDTAEIQGGYSNRGTLILKKDNPSDLPQYDDALEIPITFETFHGERDGASDKESDETSEGKGAVNGCVRSGCSGQVCVEEGEDVMTTCEFLPEYACYGAARCEKQENGVCGWTKTPKFLACMDEF